MKRVTIALLPLILLVLSGCSDPSVNMVQVGERYKFYFDLQNAWIESEVLSRTHDGWILIDAGGKTWINGNHLRLIVESK